MALGKCACVLVFTLVAAAQAKIWQSRLFSDNMILESRESYDIRPFVTGFGDTPGETVSVRFGRGTYNTTVGKDGKWRVQMNACDATNSTTLTVSGTNTTLQYNNVACGQVYVCSGQSNMELPLDYVNNVSRFINGANRPNWRLFKVPHSYSDTPLDDFPAGKDAPTWQVSTPELASQWSAVCFITATYLSEMYWGNEHPVGLIWTAWGGTRVEAWTPIEAKDKCGSTPTLPAQQSYAALYNAMIHPLTSFSIRGAFWFQGEHNVVTHSSTEEYQCTFEAMINMWRDAWQGIGDFPFVYAQLCSYTGYAPFAGHGDISTIRLAQSESLPHVGLDTTGQAVTFDLGDPKAPKGDVHSRNKVQVGYRMALQALHVFYAIQEGQNISNTDYPNVTPNPVPLHYSGPSVVEAIVQAEQVSIKFKFADELKLSDTMGCEIHRGTSFDGRTIGGECCKAHDTFQVCTGSLSNTTQLKCANATNVQLSSNTVTFGWDKGQISGVPTSVRHAYANFPQCALVNSHGLPASPFVAELATAESTDLSTALADNAAVASTPPLGWNSWNSFHCNVDERKLRGMADALVSLGLAKIGYEFVNIVFKLSTDDCWQVERYPNGTIGVDPARFPGGIKPLADYIHSKGLKFGIYSAQKEFTCQTRPGSWEHEAIDVASYCEWGVDYIKLDGCRGRGWPQLNESWIKFRAAIDECTAKRGSPMVFSVESCGDPSTCGLWIGKLANLWRTGGDIQATFRSVLSNAESNTRMAALAGPSGGAGNGGHWNDADMLQVGNIGLSDDEQRTQFTLWSIMSSPLLISVDLTLASNRTVEILSNDEVVAINQDPLGVQGVPVGANPSAQTSSCWAKPLKDGTFAAVLINLGDTTAQITCSLKDLGISSGSATQVRDLWDKKDLGPAKDTISASLASHASVMYKITA